MVLSRLIQEPLCRYEKNNKNYSLFATGQNKTKQKEIKKKKNNIKKSKKQKENTLSCIFEKQTIYDDKTKQND